MAKRKGRVTFDEQRDIAWKRWHDHFIKLLMDRGWRKGNAIAWAELTIELTPQTKPLPTTPGLPRIKIPRLVKALIREVLRDRKIPRHRRFGEIQKRAARKGIPLSMSDSTLRRAL